MTVPMVDRQQPEPFVARLVGAPALVLDVFRQILQDLGVVLIEADDDGTAAGSPPADLVVLVEPTSDDWVEARGMNVPMVVVQGERTDDAAVVDSVLAGADAVLHCDAAPEAVLAVMNEVRWGGSVMDPVHMRAVAGLARAAGARPGVDLSRRETEILASIADGKAVKQTARDLGVSPKTIENLQGRLFRKLSARNRAQAVARAHALGLL
jgi:DNA-binding NarL/FixJ family response regulator